MSIPWGWISAGLLGWSYLDSRQRQAEQRQLEGIVEINQAADRVEQAKQECLDAEAMRLAKVSEVQHELDDVTAQLNYMKGVLEERVRQEKLAKQSNEQATPPTVDPREVNHE